MFLYACVCMHVENEYTLRHCLNTIKSPCSALRASINDFILQTTKVMTEKSFVVSRIFDESQKFS